MLQSTFFSFPCCWTSASRALTACPQLAIFVFASLQSIFLLHLYKAFFVRQDAQMRDFCECNFLHCGIAVPQNSNVFWQILFVESCVLLTLHPVLLHPFLSNALVREFEKLCKSHPKGFKVASCQKLLGYPAFSAISRVKWKRDPIFKKNN